jgi:MFS family permease
LGIAATQSGNGLLPLAVALAVTGLGVGAVMSQLLAMATAGAAPEEAGALAGVVGTVQAAGNALGAAVVPIAYLSASTAGKPRAALEPYSTGLLLLLMLAVLLALISRRVRSPAGAADAAPGSP